jgi:hypothetical protein
LASLEDLADSLDSLGSLDSLDSLDSLGILEGGGALVFSTSPPGDVYWLTHATSEAPIRLSRNKEQNVN